ncbi:MAG: tetratricopeptide repeat protein [Gammaproteobacteria bacterium]|nr:tetratricopeptide repeat protein [Gammaproteobacteria bacterium]
MRANRPGPRRKRRHRQDDAAPDTDPALRKEWQQARRLLSDGELDAARAAFEKMMQAHPDKAHPSLGLAKVLKEQGQFARALEWCHKALAIDPKLAAAWNLIANLQLELNDTENAMEAFKKAAELDPENSQTLMRAGMLCMEAGHAEEAEKYLRASLLYNPGAVQVRLLLAENFQKQDQLPAAVQEINQALQLQPDFWAGHYRLGRIQLEQKDFRGARRSFERVVEHKADAAVGYFYLGVAALGLSDFELAEEAMLEALRLKPRMRVASVQLARVYAETGNFDEALKRLRRLVSEDPDSAALHKHMADVLTAAGKYPLALEEYRAVLLHAPELEETHPRLGQLVALEADEKTRANAFQRELADVKLEEKKQRERPGRLAMRRKIFKRRSGQRDNAVDAEEMLDELG